MLHLRASAVWLVVLAAGPVMGQAESTPARSLAAERIDPSGIPGALVICGGGKLPPQILARFMELAGGREARLVIVPTASRRADSQDTSQLLEPWREFQPETLTLLHTRDRAEADDPGFVAPLRDATGVWFGGGQQARIASAYVGTRVESELAALLERGGVIGGTSAGAAIQSRVMIAGGNPLPRIEQGLDLIPGLIVDQHFSQRDRKPRLVHAVDHHPELVGLGIDEKTAVTLVGRRLRVLGDCSATICLAALTHLPAKELTLHAGDVADLTALRRLARMRLGTPFPPAEPAAPRVERGSLVLGGGGRLPAAVIERFIELAGGPSAQIVVLPTAAPDPLPDRLSAVRMLRDAGATCVTALRGRTKAEVESDSFIETIDQAGGVWFGGGRQWRFVDAYEGTRALQAFRRVLQRGGVIGGSSAGASIQAEYMARGDPLGNRNIMAPGYERGFGFLPGVGVDQHFAQRGRLADMSLLVDTYPQLLGIGLDEQTALIVRGSVAEVTGQNHVYFYDRGQATPDGEPDYVRLSSGARYDLVQRQALKPD